MSGPLKVERFIDLKNDYSAGKYKCASYKIFIPTDLTDEQKKIQKCLEICLNLIQKYYEFFSKKPKTKTKHNSDRVGQLRAVQGILSGVLDKLWNEDPTKRIRGCLSALFAMPPNFGLWIKLMVCDANDVNFSKEKVIEDRTQFKINLIKIIHLLTACCQA